MRSLVVPLCVLFVSVLGAAPASAKPSQRVCVDVQIKSYRDAKRPPPRPRPRAAPATPARPAARSGAPAGAKPGAQPGAQPGTRPVSPRPAPVTRSWKNPFVTRGRRPKRATTPWRPARHHRRFRTVFRKRHYPYPPDAYLRRLVEHFVTHQDGFVAVKRGCAERITIELYPLKQGWTAFAGYTGRSQEEKVDVLQYDEFPRFAERVVAALLYGRHISATANLRTILRADSLRQYRTIKGQHHFTFTLGTSLRLAKLYTYRDGAVNDEFRLLTPLAFAMGYRGRFNAWGIDTYVRGGVGLNRLSLRADTQGAHVGHVDLGGFFGVAINFLRYARPHGMISLYYGAGAQFDLAVFTSINPETARDDRDRITGGGLNFNAVLGVEFMRANAAQFFLQLVVSAPAWLFDSQSRYSRRIRTYMPEACFVIGMML